MANSYVIHTVTMLDGFGDLIYLFHWLKLYHRSSTATNNKLILFVRSRHNLAVILQNLYSIEPEHPIFNYLKLEVNLDKRNYKLKILDAETCAILTADTGGVCGTSANVEDIFKSISSEDHLVVYYISCCYCVLYQANKKIHNSRAALEFDAPFPCNSLGLGDKNLGLLTDLDGITGNENIAASFEKLSAELKGQIFQDTKIGLATAKEFLATTPIIFGYFQAFVNTYVLHALLQSPLLQAAFAQQKTPLFFITSVKPLDDLPDSIQEAIKQKKIRLVCPPWLSRSEYQNVSEIFLNKDTLSIAVPSGDTTLTACFKAGKLPFYAHKWIKDEREDEKFKCGIFEDLKQIMLVAKQQGTLPASAGFDDCYQTIDGLTTRLTFDPSIEAMRRSNSYVYQAFYAPCIKSKKTIFFSERAAKLTKPALDYFHDHVAPFVITNYDFAHRTLPMWLKPVCSS